MKLKIDENLPIEAALILRDHAHEADTVPDEVLSGAEDEKIADRVRIESRILVTPRSGFQQYTRLSAGRLRRNHRAQAEDTGQADSAGLYQTDCDGAAGANARRRALDRAARSYALPCRISIGYVAQHTRYQIETRYLSAQFDSLRVRRARTMDLSRRELGFLMPFLAAAAAKGQQSEPQPPVHLDTNVYHPDQTTTLPNGKKKGSRIFYGMDHSGFQLEMHETVLAPGVETHAPHKHVHEEIIIMLEGTLETHVEGTNRTAETGAVIYFGSNQTHNATSVGSTPARYYVLELRGHPA